MSLPQDSWTVSEIRVTGCRVWLSLMKPSVINGGAVLGSPREGEAMAGGAWDCFSAAGGSKFSTARVRLCICVQIQVRARNQLVGTKSVFFLFRASILFFSL